MIVGNELNHECFAFMRGLLSRSLLAVIFLCLFAAGVFAQDANGTVKGTVSDQNGDRLVGAEVTLRSLASGEELATVSDTTGQFDFQRVTVGKYRLTVIVKYFGRWERTVSVIPDLSQEIPVLLSIEEGRVTVTAETGLENSVENVPQAISKITAQELRERDVSVLSQIAETETGLNIQSTSPTIGAIVVRGLTGKNVVNYIDGVRYTNSAQRGGINTFFNLNDASNLQSIEVLRGPNGAQYGSDSLGGTINLLTKAPAFGQSLREIRGEVFGSFSTVNRGGSSSALLSSGNEKIGIQLNSYYRRSNTIRTADGLDSHSAVTRFLGLPSTVLYDRNPDTEFTQYGGSVRLDLSASENTQVNFYYQRGQQDDGKRFDQLIGGDGNLRADLRNLMADFGYLRFTGSNLGFFDNGAFTISFNSQREERVNQGGQGNPFANITHQYERTNATGVSFFLGKSFSSNTNVLFGGEFYHERINSPAFTFRPSDRTFFLSRPRVPDETSFDSGGLYVQASWQAVPERLRFSGAFRYSAAAYKADSSASPIVDGAALWPDDELRVGDFSGRIGAVLKLNESLNVRANYSRGFRFPSMTDLGTLGLTGDGFEVDHVAASRLGGTIGTTADQNALNSGIPVSKQGSELSQNFDLSLRFNSRRFNTSATAFYLLLEDTIVKQALILPQGAVGTFLGDQQITNQLPNGVVFVPLSTSPVLVRANFTDARLLGFEYDARLHVSDELDASFGFTYIRAEDTENGQPPNIEGGTPPPNGFLNIRYQPGRKVWLEAVTIFADRQSRLSSLDLGDRRTGASRSRSQIANFFRRGACVRGLTNNPDGVCGSGDETILLTTGETLAQVQNRVLGSLDSAPLFPYLPGYLVLKLRGGVKFDERSTLYWSFENVFDQFYRNPSWGIDGGGRGIRIGYRYAF